MPDHLQLRLAWLERGDRARRHSAIAPRLTASNTAFKHSSALGASDARRPMTSASAALSACRRNRHRHGDRQSDADRSCSARGVHVGRSDRAESWPGCRASDIDFFEEIAKFQGAAQGVGADHERALRLQPILRSSASCSDGLPHLGAISGLPATAQQSLPRRGSNDGCASWRGAIGRELAPMTSRICIPTEEARELATRTQQILDATRVGRGTNGRPARWQLLHRKPDQPGRSRSSGIAGEDRRRSVWSRPIEDGTIEGLMR